MSDSQNNLNGIFSLAIDVIRLGITQQVDEVTVKNVYVDVDDTHIRVVPFEFTADIDVAGLIVNLPPTTLGSIYEIRLLSQGNTVLSAYFNMPKDDCFLSDLPLYTAFPPRESYPVDVVNWGDIKGDFNNQTDLSGLIFTTTQADQFKQAVTNDVDQRINGITISFNQFSESVNSQVSGVSESANTRAIQLEQKINTDINTVNNSITSTNQTLDSTKQALENKDSELQGQIDGIGGGKFAYTTYAKMESAAALPDEDPLKLPANSSVDVTNDTDPLKNGTYSYDGAVFAKSIYDPLTQAKAYTDTNKADILSKVQNTFDTKALMTASPLPDGSKALVDMDTEANNGLYVKTAGAWVKSEYSPLPQSFIGYEYIDGNIAKVKSITHTNRRLSAINSMGYSTVMTSRGMVVSAGDELYLYPISDAASPRFALFSGPEATPEQLVSYQGEKRTDPESKKVYTYLLVPEGATYLVFNVTDENSDEWAIYDTGFSDDLTPAKKVAVSIESIPLHDLGGLNIDDVVTKRSLSADLVSARNIITNRNMTAVNTINYTPTNSQWVLRLKVQAGEVYYARIVAEKNANGQFVDGFRSFYGKYYEDNTNSENFTQNIDFQATDKENIYRFTVPDVEGVNVVFIASSRLMPADMLEGLEPFSIQRNYFDDSLVGVEQDGVVEVAGMPVVDSYARELANVRPHPVQNRLSDKKVWAFGSSTTSGTRGGFLKYLDRAFNTNVVNKGSSGGQIGRMVNMLIAKTGLTEYPGSSFDFPLLDFTDLKCVLLMIGTNDSVFNVSGWGTVADLPTDSVYDYENTDDYWNTRFNETFIAKMGYFIEYLRWKAPQAELHIVLPIRVNQGDTYDRMTLVLDAIAVVAKHYSVHLINATDESGLSYKDMAVNGVYSYDGLHLNELGNAVLGNFLAQKVLSFG